MKIFLLLLSFLPIHLFAQQGGFTKTLPLDKIAFPSQVIELKNKNYLCILSSSLDSTVRNKTKLVIFSPRGLPLDSLVFSAPDKDLNAYKVLETSYGLCLMGVIKKDTSNSFWVVNLTKELQIINQQFKPLLTGDISDLIFSLDKDSSIIVMFKYDWINVALTSFSKINKKGDIKSVKNIVGSLGASYASGIVVRTDSARYNFLYAEGYSVCDTSFNNWRPYYFDIPWTISILAPYTTEVLMKNDTTAFYAGEATRPSYKINLFFAEVKNYKFTNFREIPTLRDTSYYIAFKKGIDTTKDGRFVYVGGTYNSNFSILDIKNTYLRLIKLDSNYNVIWTKDYGGDANYRVFGIAVTSDGGCIMYAGRHNHNPLQQVDVFVMKVDGNGLVTSTNSIPMPQESIIPYPNPSNGQLQFKKEDPSVSSRFDLNLYDISGKLVFQKTETDLSETFDLSHLSEGNYLFHIKKGENIIAIGKWMKIK
jgi:hypothetical protein